jgi:hypothetical protein
VDINSVVTGLKSFIGQYHTQFVRLARSESQLLEIGALMLAAEHYRRQGFDVHVVNKVSNRFKLKVSARGKPFNFSWYRVSKNSMSVEIHGNLPVGSAYRRDEGIYAVDVGIAEADKLPTDAKQRKKWKSMNNNHLITFIEAKKLVVYPMLLAQFIGMVHEIKPSFMKKNYICKDYHFYPALVTIGGIKGTSASIRDGFRKRHYKINVIPKFDIHVSRLAYDKTAASPFEPTSTLRKINNKTTSAAHAAFTDDDIPF